MRTQSGSLWYYHALGHWICIPTNGVVNRDGLLIMGKGLACDAAERFPEVRKNWGNLVAGLGNHPFAYPPGRLISFPTKHHWSNPSDLSLIRSSAITLTLWWPQVMASYTMASKEILPICLPKVGCGNGGLDWETQVRPILAELLHENYMVVI